MGVCGLGTRLRYYVVLYKGTYIMLTRPLLPSPLPQGLIGPSGPPGLPGINSRDEVPVSGLQGGVAVGGYRCISFYGSC